MSRSCALDRPRPRRTKHPERWGIQVNEQNRAILQRMIHLLEIMQDVYAHDPNRSKHREAVRQSLAMLRTVLDSNPHELVLDPDDFVRRSIMLYLDETCWGLILQLQQTQYIQPPYYAASY